MISKMKITYLLLVIVLINLIDAKFTDVPPPPKRPDRFRSREELKRYLQKIHEYHSIVDRWRLRRQVDDSIKSSDENLFEFFDINHDHFISPKEFSRRLRL